MDIAENQAKLLVSVRARLDQANEIQDKIEREKRIEQLEKFYGAKFPELFPPKNPPEKPPETILPRTENPNYDEVLEKCEEILQNVKDKELSNAFLRVAQQHIALSVSPLSEAEKKKLPPEKLAVLSSDPVQARQEIFKTEQDQREISNEEEARPTRSPILLSDFSTLKIEPPKWVVEGLFAEGLNLCCSYPKEGKSYLMLNTSFSVLRGLPLCGKFACEQAPILHFSLEENNSELLERFQRLGEKFDSPDAGFFTMDNGPMNVKDLTSDVKFWLKKKPKTRLIVVDTMGKIQPEGSKNKSDYQNDVDFLGNLQWIAKKNRLAMVLVHHTTKTICLEDPFREIIGSVGTWGTVDMACVLRPNFDEKTWTLFSKGKRGRLQKVALSRRLGAFNGEQIWSGWWDYLGDADEYLETLENRKILETLKDYPEGLGPKEISSYTGMPENQISIRLTRLKKKKKVANPKRSLWLFLEY